MEEKLKNNIKLLRKVCQNLNGLKFINEETENYFNKCFDLTTEYLYKTENELLKILKKKG